MGARLGFTHLLTLLAEAQALDGTIVDVFSTLEDALQANPEEILFRPSILTCRGDLRVTIGQSELAEADFREAIALAQRMRAKAWELRAATSLARLLQKRGDHLAARELLAPIHSWFTEGFETYDLKHAKALLDKLAA